MAPQDFFTLTSIGTLASAVVIVTMVSVGVRNLLRRDSAWIPFITALLVSYLGAGASGAFQNISHGEFPSKEFFIEVLTWVLPIANAFLLFVTALGGTQVGNAITRRPG